MSLLSELTKAGIGNTQERAPQVSELRSLFVQPTGAAFLPRCFSLRLSESGLRPEGSLFCPKEVQKFGLGIDVEMAGPALEQEFLRLSKEAPFGSVALPLPV